MSSLDIKLDQSAVVIYLFCLTVSRNYLAPGNDVINKDFTGMDGIFIRRKSMRGIIKLSVQR